jgi:adenine-specific DNA-methyltransferase
MSRLTELIRQAREKDPTLGAELEREYRTLAGRRAFGLNFERHRPEAVELPGRPIRRGDKVRALPERGSTDRGDQRLWRVARIEKADGRRLAHLALLDASNEVRTALVDDLVVVAEFRDPIHPGLVPTGSVRRGGDKPAHTVINGENFHALKALTYTHRGKIDAIYIDPPYNTGARDWKYNNDYVESDDLYRHSKWLAFMERRLLLAKELLNPDNSVLIVTIDEKEVHRLGLLLDQLFPECDIQTVTSVTNPAGSLRTGRFTRVEEYLFFVFLGAAVASKWVTRLLDGGLDSNLEPRMPTVWFTAIRQGGGGALRSNRTTPVLFYPIHLDAQDGRFHSVGEPLPSWKSISDYEPPTGTIAMWPLHTDGTEQTWRFSGEQMKSRFEAGTVRLGRRDPVTGLRSVTYLRPGTIKKIERGEFEIVGRAEDGSIDLRLAVGNQGSVVPPAAVWRMRSHFARDYGTGVLKSLVPGSEFPFPKSLYSVEDTLRIATGGKRDAVVLDFFAGSGTTAHAVMRLNKQDGGRRQCISVTNNEVSADEQRRLRQAGLRPGDPEWEAFGICDHITKPRIEAAITGRTPDGDPIKGDYKFTDEFPMAEGFEENAEFFTLTYESPVAVGHNRAFTRVAALLWLRAGAEGRRIEHIPDRGWDLADTYAILFDLDCAADFATAIEPAERVRMVFVVTDDDRRFQSVARQLPDRVEVVRLYESYLSNFRFTAVES